MLLHADNANTASDDQLLEDDEFSLLDEAEHAVAHTPVANSDNDSEPYEVADEYPEVQLAEGVLESLLSDDPDAACLADMVEDIQCQLETVKRRLEARTMELQNKAKAEAVARQQEEDENAIMGAIEDPEYRQVLADVVRLLDKGQAGPLLDVIRNLKGMPSRTTEWEPDTATKLTTSPLPEVSPYVEPAPIQQYVSKPAPTTSAPGWL
jgi:hypothetical protein